MIFRRMEYDDVPEVAHLFLEAYSDPPWNEKWSYEKAFDRIVEVFEAKKSVCVVCLYEQRIVGAAQCLLFSWTSGYQLDIRELFVDKKYQNLKIGTQLLDYLPTFLPRGEPITIILSTLRDTKLMSFYEKNGFQVNQNLIYYYREI